MVDVSFWRAAADSGYVVPSSPSRAVLTRELLTALGSPDPELRDELAYSTLAIWIERGEYSVEELRDLRDVLRANLDVGRGETGTPSVFLRSFSVLVLAEIVKRHAAAPFLRPAELSELVETSHAYALSERDLRGFVPGQGWAHAAAHTADLLHDLGALPELSAPEREVLLSAVRALLSAPQAFLYSEEERLARAAGRLLADAPEQDARRWLASLANATSAEWFATTEDAARRLNTKGFLHSLRRQSCAQQLEAAVNAASSKVNLL